MALWLIAAGIWLTLKTGWVQLRLFPTAIRNLGRRTAPAAEALGAMSPRRALMTALAAALAVSGVAGTAVAVAAGGPGTVFWMAVTGVLAMAPAYAEGVLAIRFRSPRPDGGAAGGPMEYCKLGIGGRRGKILGTLFAAAGAVTALFGAGSLSQSGQIAADLQQQFGIEPIHTGVAVGAAVALVLLGGVGRIGRVAAWLVPGMLLIYLAGAIAVVLNNLSAVPSAVALIVRSAFSPAAVFGGAAGVGALQAVRLGAAHGALSNASGLGVSALAHGAARTLRPKTQGTLAMLAPFFATLVLCLLTGLVITISGAYREAAFLGGDLIDVNLAVHAFNLGLPASMAGWSGLLPVSASLVFGFAGLIAWSYYGQACLTHLLGGKIVRPYLVLFVILVCFGALLDRTRLGMVRELAGICYIFLAAPNLIALILLVPVVATSSRDPDGRGEVRPAAPGKHGVE